MPDVARNEHLQVQLLYWAQLLQTLSLNILFLQVLHPLKYILYSLRKRINKLAAGGLNAPEVNAGRSIAEWNPVSIVAMVLRKVCASLVLCFVPWIVCHALKQIV
jgi:hypothetical protein